MFHKHDWKVVAKTYTGNAREIGLAKAPFAERILFGVTTILWECGVCHEIRREEMLGKERNNNVEEN